MVKKISSFCALAGFICCLFAAVKSDNSITFGGVIPADVWVLVIVGVALILPILGVMTWEGRNEVHHRSH